MLVGLEIYIGSKMRNDALDRMVVSRGTEVAPESCLPAVRQDLAGPAVVDQQ